MNTKRKSIVLTNRLPAVRAVGFGKSVIKSWCKKGNRETGTTENRIVLQHVSVYTWIPVSLIITSSCPTRLRRRDLSSLPTLECLKRLSRQRQCPRI